MSDNLPAPSTGGWVAEWLTNGKLPGAAKAITQLVGDTANAGSAWINIATAKGEQIQQRIKTETAGSKAVMDALAAEAARQGVSDPAVVAIALQQFGSSAIRKHLSRVAVAKEAVDELNAGDPTGDAPDELDEDWLNKFENIASDASSERMRKLLGKVLAGEIRKPGAYSFATLNFINILDTTVAASIAALVPFVVENNMIPFSNRFDFTENYAHYMLLRDYGLIGDGVRRKINALPSKSIIFRMRSLGMIIKDISADEISLDILPLTRIGTDIFPLIDANTTMDQLISTAEEALKIIPCGSILLGSIEILPNNGEKFTPLEEKKIERPSSQPSTS